MKLKDEQLINDYMLQSLLFIQSSKELQGIVNQMLLDGELYSHSVSVCKLATQLAIEEGFDRDTIQDMNLAGLLHDIGKILSPKEILYKPGKLTADEFQIIKKHPVDGFNLLRGSGVSDQVLDLVLNHHEKVDGSGYPSGVSNKTLLEDIITTADIFSALTEHRVYHNALSSYDAFKMISNFGNLNHDLVMKLSAIVDI